MHAAPDSADSTDSTDSARLDAYETAATGLALLGDRRLAELLETAAPLGSGIGGTSALLDVAGTPVFVKRVPLTDRERAPEHRHSTSDVFGLPAYCHYGVGTPGFGAWRELAAHRMTTNWVLTGAYDGFPLLYHWRVLPGAAPALPDELADVEESVAYWGGGPEIRRRLEELRDASASLLLFLEYIPTTLHDWLSARIAAGPAEADTAVRQVEEQLGAGIALMNDRGLLHFDGHFQNVLTDGRRLYFTDFGLALSTRFDLSPAEHDFAARHHAHDPAYTLSYLVNWLITALYGHRRPEREALIRACAAGAEPPPGPAAARAAIVRHAPTAAVVTDFYGRLMDESRQLPYPAQEIDRALLLGRR
ncbi:protein kinase family protein [Streptomyces sp. NPDC058953]|uniref:protein kinase family protein n=1 Tax=unclassified Streptomyces TaxID=2593676 RepID=UPI003676BD9C